MRTLKFSVDGQRLRKRIDCDFSGLVAGSVGYLRAEFEFSDDWAGCKKAASFWIEDQEYAVRLDSNDSCIIPSEALSGALFKVSVVGIRSDYKISTTRTRVHQEVF